MGALHEYLLANVSEKISVRTAASLVNMSDSTFMKYFKRVTGETYVSYLTRLRLERAAELLENTNKPIAEISYAVGFPDQSCFSTVSFVAIFRGLRAKSAKKPLRQGTIPPP